VADIAEGKAWAPCPQIESIFKMEQ
jgi:hypothetical protein